MARSAEEAFRHTAEVAKAAGLTLLATQWAGAKANYLFQCRKGHEFERRASVVTRGSTSCELCARAAVRQRFLELLAKRSLACLEGDYLGANIRHHFECEQGHCWDTEGRKILEGSGCPACARARTAELNTDANGLERLQQAAGANGGRCRTEVYSGIAASYEWECANGHRWHARGDNVVNGRWCRACASRRHGEEMIDPNGLTRIQAAAASHGGGLRWCQQAIPVPLRSRP